MRILDTFKNDDFSEEDYATADESSLEGEDL
jgi:hypothetical protein